MQGRQFSLPSALLIVTVLAASSGNGQTTALSTSDQKHAQDERFRFSVEVETVTLDVVVTDRKGRFVQGLKREDFQVLEEGVPQEIFFFTPEPTPVTALVLLDTSSSVRSNLTTIQKAAFDFVDSLGSRDKARIGLFNHNVWFGPEFTRDIYQHMAMMRSMRPSGRTALYDAILASLDKLGTVGDRKALLVFTDGDDSKPHPEGSESSVEDVIEGARRSEAAIYPIGFIGWSLKRGLSVNEDLLSRIARETGGRAFFPEKEKEMKKSFQRIREELHNQYRIAYQPSKSSGVSGWRRIQVRIPSKPRVNVRHRFGYYVTSKNAEDTGGP